jgi:hypothetical protein
MVIQNMDGQISCKSKIEKGAQFDFYICVGSQRNDIGLSDF